MFWAGAYRLEGRRVVVGIGWWAVSLGGGCGGLGDHVGNPAGLVVAVAFGGDVVGAVLRSGAGPARLASRARKAVTAQPALISGDPDPAHNEVVGRLMAAMAAGDLDTVVSLLHPDVTFTGDSNGKAPTAVRAVRGSDKVVRFILGLVQRYGPGLFGANQLALVNGELGAYTAGLPGVDGYRAMAPRITAITVRDGKVCALWDIANPDKFTGSPLKERRAQPTGRGRHHRN